MPNDHDDEEPPDMNEPDDEQPPTVSVPRNAPLHLKMVLSTVRDEAEKQLLLDTYAEMAPGLSRELFGQVGAYLSAILDHHAGRPDQTADELFAVAGQLRNVSEEWGTALVAFEDVVKLIQAGSAGSQPTGAKGGTLDFGNLIGVHQIVSKEVDRAVAAATAVNARNLKIACLCCFLAGIIAAALFVHWF